MTSGSVKATANVLFYNKDLIEKDGMTIPETWEDLTKPEWKGKIA